MLGKRKCAGPGARLNSPSELYGKKPDQQGGGGGKRIYLRKRIGHVESRVLYRDEQDQVGVPVNHHGWLDVVSQRILHVVHLFFNRRRVGPGDYGVQLLEEVGKDCGRRPGSFN